MLNTTIYKDDFNEELYLKCSKWANENDCIIKVYEDRYVVEEIEYNLTEEKEKIQRQLYREYKRELNNTLDPMEFQASTMMLSDTDESIDIIANDGTPKQYTQDELTELLNSELQKRNELLLKYKTLYNKVKNAKKVETVHEVKW